VLGNEKVAVRKGSKLTAPQRAIDGELAPKAVIDVGSYADELVTD
jgi:hypothetical protein